MLTTFRLARSTPFAMAEGTSFALPTPYPTLPRPSPTTTRALKEKFFPPFTTFVTRLMWTTRSFSSPRSLSRSANAHLSSEFQAALASRLGQHADAAVIAVAAAVEHGALEPA